MSKTPADTVEEPEVDLEGDEDEESDVFDDIEVGRWIPRVLGTSHSVS